MSDITTGQPSGPENGRNDFSQRPFILPEEKFAKQLIEWMNMLGLARDHIAEFLVLTYGIQNDPEAKHNPAAYIRSMPAWDALKLRKAGTSNDFILERLIRGIWLMDPLSFYMSYWSVIHGGNNAVMEQSYIFPYFTDRIKDGNIVLVDPSPFLLKLFALWAKAKGKSLEIYTSDRAMCELYNVMDEINSVCSVKHTDELHQLTDGTELLYCAPYTKKENVYSLLAKISFVLKNCSNYAFHALLPNAWVDKGVDGADIRQILFDAHHIEKITIISKKLCNTEANKCQCLIELTPRMEELEYSFLIQRLQGELIHRGGKMMLTQLLSVPVVMLIPSVHSIVDIHRMSMQGKNKSNAAIHRNSAKEYYAIREIPFRSSVHENCSNSKKRIEVKIDTKYAHIAIQNEKQCLTIKPHTVKENKSEEYMEKLLLCDENVRSFLREMFIGETAFKCLSVKTFWALYVFGDPKVKDSYKRYDEDRSMNTFGGTNSAFSMLNGLLIASATSLSIETAVDDYMKRMNIPQKELLRVLEQVQVVFAVARNMGLYCGENPVDAIIALENKRIRKKSEGRRKAGRNSLTCGQLQVLFDDLDSDTEHEGLALATKFRMIGVHTDEIGALKMGDYHWDKTQKIHYFEVHAHVVGSDVEEYGWYDLGKIRSLAIPAKLDEQLEVYYKRRKNQLKQEGYTQSQINALPMLAGTLDQTQHLLPRAIRSYGSRFIDGLEMLAMLPPSKNRRGTEDYYGDWFASSFKEVASTVGGMEEDEIAYCLGHRIPSTYGRHYCGFDERYSLIVLRSGLNNIFNHIYSRDKIDTTERYGTLCGKEIAIPVPLCVERSKVVINMRLPETGTLTLRTSETGRLFVDYV